MKPDKWYQRRLAGYFEKEFGQYEDQAEFFPDPAPNQWLFDIPELCLRIELTCDDKGRVTEMEYPIRRADDISLPDDIDTK